MNQQQRFMSTEKKNTNNNNNNNIEKDASESSSSTANIREEIGEKLHQAKEAAKSIRFADFMTVLGSASLFTGIIFGPVILDKIRRTRMSEDDFLTMTDDEIVQLTREVIEFADEFKKKRSNGGEESSINGNEVEEKDEENESSRRGNNNLVVDTSSDIVSRVLQTKIVQDALLSLTLKVLSSPEVLKAAQILFLNIWNDFIADPQTYNQILKLLQDLIKDPETQKSLSEIITQLCQNPEVNEVFTEMIVSLTEDEKVMEATQRLLTNSVHKSLNDPEVLEHSMEFAADVVGDDVVQRTSGEALWNTISYSFKPENSSLLTILGISLVLTSFYLLSTNHSPSIEDIAAAMEKSKAVAVIPAPSSSSIQSSSNNRSATSSTRTNAFLSALYSPFKSILSSVSNFCKTSVTFLILDPLQKVTSKTVSFGKNAILVPMDICSNFVSSIHTNFVTGVSTLWIPFSKTVSYGKNAILVPIDICSNFVSSIHTYIVTGVGAIWIPISKTGDFVTNLFHQTYGMATTSIGTVASNLSSLSTRKEVVWLGNVPKECYGYIYYVWDSCKEVVYLCIEKISPKNEDKN
eukprot:CAMPEP_0178958346 /NCGR_PEP_ID=MMETSP0789-20121207/11562_1 /TAXON_ID=3005 /ORGANISM="Rhizosolenia setigera, Strain CCMP 1694" /LENGTH=577 /DNA_ID=CAMNT_0020640983 /DNA_START=456 /DNA_END=2189 /DNA_ORIENTATION=+